MKIIKIFNKNCGALGATIFHKRRGNILYLIIGKIFTPIFRNWDKISFYYFTPIFRNWDKIFPDIFATLLQ
jgi:hypothetical protein